MGSQPRASDDPFTAEMMDLVNRAARLILGPDPHRAIEEMIDHAATVTARWKHRPVAIWLATRIVHWLAEDPRGLYLCYYRALVIADTLNDEQNPVRPFLTTALLHGGVPDPPQGEEADALVLGLLLVLHCLITAKAGQEEKRLADARRTRRRSQGVRRQGGPHP